MVIMKLNEFPESCHKCPLLYVTSICDGTDSCPIRQTTQTIGEWVSVNERLPDSFTRVLGFMAWNSILTVEYQMKNWYFPGNITPLPEGAVTYWMLLPETPKENEVNP